MDFTTGAWWVAICFGILAALVCLVGWLEEVSKRKEAEEQTPDLPPGEDDQEPKCKVCGHDKSWVTCWWCDEDEDDCFVCGGADGWYACYNCHPDLADDKEPEHAADTNR